MTKLKFQRLWAVLDENDNIIYAKSTWSVNDTFAQPLKTKLRFIKCQIMSNYMIKKWEKK